jgi:hypothetical protein
VILQQIALYNKGMKPKVYLETSVISYLPALQAQAGLTARASRDILIAANQQVTQEWWQERLPSFDIYVSELVGQEASSGMRMWLQNVSRRWLTAIFSTLHRGNLPG